MGIVDTKSKRNAKAAGWNSWNGGYLQSKSNNSR